MLYSVQNPQLPSLKKQSGLATILVIIIIGMLLTTSMLAVIANNRSTQEKQVATHAIVHSQAGLWTGVELMREYIDGLDSTQRGLLEGQSITLDFDLSDSVYNIEIIEYTAKDETTSQNEVIQATIKFYEANAKSTSAVEVFFEVVPDSCATTPCVPETILGDMNFYGDLSISGTTTVKITTSSTINIDGNVAITGSVANLDNINATGNVDLTAGSSSLHFINIKTNGDFIASAGSVAVLTAKGNVNLSGNYEALDVTADGTITSSSNNLNSRAFRAGSNIHVSNGGVILAKSNTKVTAGDTSRVKNIISRGTVFIHKDAYVGSGSSGLRSVKSYGYVDCKQNYKLSSTNLTVNPAPSVIDPSISVATGLTVSQVVSSGCANTSNNVAGWLTDDDELLIEAVAEIDPFVMIKPHVNVWDLKGFANYAFSYDADAPVVKDRIRIEVKGIKGKEDGLYYLRGNKKNQIFCSTLKSQAQANGEYWCDKTKGYITPCSDVNDSCFSATYSYSVEAGEHVEWKIRGSSIATGTYFFEGDLTDAVAFSIATKLVTGNYRTSTGMDRAVAPNYAGFQAVCKNNMNSITDGNVGSPGGGANNFGQFSPLDMCPADGTYISTVLSNVVVAAGGIDYSKDPQVYEGGLINITGTVSMFGTMIAGDRVSGSGTLNLTGAMVALNENDAVTAPNVLSGSSANLNQINSGTYDKTAIPSTDCDRGDDGQLEYKIEGVVVYKYVVNNVVQYRDRKDFVNSDGDTIIGNVITGVAIPTCRSVWGDAVEVPGGEKVAVSWVRFL
ncbi:MAG: hypothetical protein HRU38_18940 [Saccharospirillaceae bacterium]|nr:hypothetical protein [Pseudomonadales bacterium]NRB80712.1 hypothetical protein [Saccharospirillaceae bacterium]